MALQKPPASLRKHRGVPAINNSTTQCKKAAQPTITQKRCKGVNTRDEALSEKALVTHKKVLDNPSASEDCKKRANHIQSIVERFNDYREALPYARATNELSNLGDEKDDASKQNARQQSCITLLPVDDASKLNAELGLPPGTITDEMLRDDKTGFRAGVFRDEGTGKLILVGRDTQPYSMVDWMTNTRNGQGEDTPQYKAMRELTQRLVKKNVDFNLAGYSKGGGLAQEAGLIARNSRVYVFNSAGLHENSLKRLKLSSFDPLKARTRSYSARGDFLTFMNNTTDPQQQIANGRFLRDQLKGGFGISPMKIKYRNPAMKAAHDEKGWFAPDPDPDFNKDKQAYLSELDSMIAGYEQKHARGETFRLFPPVRSGRHETVVNSGSALAKHMPGAGDIDASQPNFAKLIQHRMSVVLNAMEKSVKADRVALSAFAHHCGK